MNSQSLNSISFVISAVYTVTFANTIYLMTVKDATLPFSLTNMYWSTDKILCGIISLIMTLRFFFGNNQYISDVMSDQSKSPWIKFYHFILIAIQSIVLLVCSYSIPDYVSFIYGISLLFIIEILWYAIAMIIDRSSILPFRKKENKGLLHAELSNLGFVIGIIFMSYFIDDKKLVWLWLSFLLFLTNTIIDARKNITTYMS